MHHKWIALRNECVCLYSNNLFRWMLRLGFLLTLLLIYGHAHAEGVDVASGAADDLQATEKGTGTKILYAVEFFIGAVTFIAKRSAMSLVYIVVISLFINFVSAKYLV